MNKEIYYDIDENINCRKLYIDFDQVILANCRKLYIDFDQVILATEDLLFIEYEDKISKGIKVDKHKYLCEFDWEWLVYNSMVIANSIEILKSIPEASILTKVHSLDNEATAKIKYLRDNGVDNEVIIVPHKLRKIDVVSACGNILVDDAVHNLDDWKEAGGIPIFFNKDGLNLDNWGEINTKYKKIRTLNMFKNRK